MADLDDVAPNYRRAKDRWPDAPTLARCYQSLVHSFGSNGHGTIEFVKSFIECICVTILAEFGEPMPSAPSTTDLLVAALRPLGMENQKGASKLGRVLTAFNRLADALTAIRNEQGAVAHGRDAFLDGMTADHARAFVHTGDAIVAVLLSALEGTNPDLLVTREPYERFAHLNDRIDRAVELKAHVDKDSDRPVVVVAVATSPGEPAIEFRVELSRLLYGVDRPGYIELLKTVAETVPSAREVGSADGEKRPAAKPAIPVTVAPVPVGFVTLSNYRGRLAPLRRSFEGFLDGQRARFDGADSKDGDLIDSLLATADENMGWDWKERETLRSRLKVALGRVIVHFGVAAETAELVAEGIVEWMAIHGPDSPEAPEGKA